MTSLSASIILNLLDKATTSGEVVTILDTLEYHLSDTTESITQPNLESIQF